MAPRKKIKNPRAPSEVTQAWVEAVVSQYEATRSPGATVKVTSFQVNPGCGEQDNFQSDVMRIQAEAVLTYNNSSAASPTPSTTTPSSFSPPTTPLASSSSPKHYSFIAKFLCGNELQQETARNFGAPKREMLALAEVVPALNAFQKQHGNDKYRVYAPEYVYGACGTGEYVLVMQDLREAGFVMVDKQQGLDLPHLKLTIRHLAHFHAVSYAYNCTNNFREEYPDFQQKDFLEGILVLMTRVVLEGFKDIFEIRKEEFAELVEVLSTNTKALSEEMKEVFSLNGDKPLACFCHGDFWSNNLLFKNNENGDVEDLMMVDWGAVRWASPIMDFQWLIHTSTKLELRDNHLMELQRLYFDTFTAAAAELGATLNDWGFEDFLGECRRTAVAGMLVGVMINCVSMAKSSKKLQVGTLSQGTWSKAKLTLVKGILRIAKMMSAAPFKGIMYKAMKKSYKVYFDELSRWEDTELMSRITDLFMEAYRAGILNPRQISPQ